MADPFIVSRIRNLPLFQNLPPDQLEAAAEAVELFEIQPNDYIFRQGYPAQGMYILIDGRAILTQTGPDGAERMAGDVRANQFLGEAALFKPMTETLSLRVVERAIVLFLARQRLQTVLAARPEIKSNLTTQYMTAVANEGFVPAFKGQRQGEVLLLRTRRHLWSLLRQFILPVLLMIGLIIVAVMLNLGLISLVIAGLALIGPGIWMYYLYDGWNDDFITITDQRVIHEDNSAFSVDSNISEIPISSIHEVNFQIPPEPFALMLKYGTVNIKTAGQSGNMTLDFLPNPQRFQQIVFNNQKNYQQSVKSNHRETIRAEIDRFLTSKEAQGATTNNPAAVQQTARVPLLSTRYVNDKGEQVYRKHLSVWTAHIFLPVVLIMVGGLGILVTLLGINIASLSGIQLALAAFLLVIGVAWFWYAHWDWSNDMYILTEDAVRIIHRRPLWLQDNVEQLVLTKVDNVISNRSGLFNFLLDRGDVSLFLLGDDKKQAKVFASVHRPEEVQKAISDQRAKALARVQQGEVQRQHQTITEYLDVYHERVAELSRARAQQEPPAQQPPPAPPSDPNATPPQPRTGVRPPRIPNIRRD